MLVAVVRTDVSEENIASVIKVKRISELGTTLAVISNRNSVLQLLVTANVVPTSLILFTLKTEEILSSETSVLARTTRRKIPDDGILLPYYVRMLVGQVQTLTLPDMIEWLQCLVRHWSLGPKSCECRPATDYLFYR
jgi:hypothetical protein